MHKASAFNSRDAVANISSVAAVQQAEIAGAIGKLASTVATDLQEVQEYVLHEEEPGAAASATTSELQQGVVQKQIEDMETVSGLLVVWLWQCVCAYIQQNPMRGLGFGDAVSTMPLFTLSLELHPHPTTHLRTLTHSYTTKTGVLW